MLALLVDTDAFLGTHGATYMLSLIFCKNAISCDPGMSQIKAKILADDFIKFII